MPMKPINAPMICTSKETICNQKKAIHSVNISSYLENNTFTTPWRISVDTFEMLQQTDFSDLKLETWDILIH